MIKLKSLLKESPLTSLGSRFLSKTVDHNEMHQHRFKVYAQPVRGVRTFLGGIDVKDDALRYAKAYFDTHFYNDSTGSKVIVLRSYDGKVIKEFTK